MMNKQPKINSTNIIAYIQGNIRYFLYYSRFKFLIRKHVRDQIDFRIKFMDKECYENGTCKLCGCVTTALQMADKQCDKPCYPPMMDKISWKVFVTGEAYYPIIDESVVWSYNPKYERLYLSKYTGYSGTTKRIVNTTELLPSIK